MRRREAKSGQTRKAEDKLQDRRDANKYREIEDTEGLAYDAAQDVFYISSGSTRGTIFEVDRECNILASTDLLNDYRSPITGGKPKLKGLELAPSSDPNDGDKMSLYAVDYGYDQEPDGRLFEINLHSDWAIA